MGYDWLAAVDDDATIVGGVAGLTIEGSLTLYFGLWWWCCLALQAPFCCKAVKQKRFDKSKQCNTGENQQGPIDLESNLLLRSPIEASRPILELHAQLPPEMYRDTDEIYLPLIDFKVSCLHLLTKLKWRLGTTSFIDPWWRGIFTQCAVQKQVTRIRKSRCSTGEKMGNSPVFSQEHSKTATLKQRKTGRELVLFHLMLCFPSCNS